MISSAWGSYQEGQSAKEASDYNARIERQNAEMSASMVEQSGALDASRQRRDVSKLIGTQKAGYAGAGVELSGSPLDAMINTAAEGEYDAQIMEYNTRAKATSIRYGGASQAAYDEKMGNIYATSGTMKAGSTLLTQGSKIGTSYLASTPQSYQGTYGSLKLDNPYKGY